MAKLVVNIKGRSEEFGLTDDARDIGGNNYLTISNGNKKQYARLGNDATKLIIKKNNQNFYVQKDPIYFSEKFFKHTGNNTLSLDVYFPIGNYSVDWINKNFSISNPDLFKVIINSREIDRTYYTFVIIMHGGDVIFNGRIIGRADIHIKRV